MKRPALGFGEVEGPKFYYCSTRSEILEVTRSVYLLILRYQSAWRSWLCLAGVAEAGSGRAEERTEDREKQISLGARSYLILGVSKSIQKKQIRRRRRRKLGRDVSHFYMRSCRMACVVSLSLSLYILLLLGCPSG